MLIHDTRCVMDVVGVGRQRSRVLCECVSGLECGTEYIVVEE